jgi:hypothetical protein
MSLVGWPRIGKAATERFVLVIALVLEIAGRGG